MTTVNLPEKAQDLLAEATILDQKVNIKEVQQDWLLITYDIPHSEEGDKARTVFLDHARRIGAVQHTESVYFLPWDDKANSLVLEMPAICKVYIWYASSDEATARELTRHYDAVTLSWIEDIQSRLERIELHALEGKRKLATNMMERTASLVNELDKVVLNRGSQALLDALQSIKNSMTNLQQRWSL